MSAPPKTSDIFSTVTRFQKINILKPLYQTNSPTKTFPAVLQDDGYPEGTHAKTHRPLEPWCLGNLGFAGVVFKGLKKTPRFLLDENGYRVLFQESFLIYNWNPIWNLEIGTKKTQDVFGVDC